jgi:signal transduction histidine kinase
VGSDTGLTSGDQVTRGRGLRSSITAIFAAGALGLSAALALGTYLSARHLLLEQRERTATRQAFTDAALVRDRLFTSGGRVTDALGAISPPPGTVLYVHRDGRWYSSSLDRAADHLVAEVRPIVEDGSVGMGWTDATVPGAVVVGVPLPAVGAEYYEVAVAQELDQTLRTLRIALITFAALTTIAGAMLGRAASRRALTPLFDVTTAAVKIAGGDMSARLRNTDDPDLAALVGAFNNMVDELDERIQRDAKFAADVSHELKTPLTTLTTSLSLLQGSTVLPARPARAVELMAEELERFRRALEDLLALGRLDADVQDTPLTEVGIRDLVQQALLASGRTPSLLDPAPAASRDPVALVDHQQLLRALVNLFENADIHGGGLTRVRVLSRGDVADIQVEDRGPGVPVQERERIFERFARASSRKHGTGSGLGLSIVDQTLRNHHGSVWCTESPAGGAVFVIRLPTIGGQER